MRTPDGIRREGHELGQDPPPTGALRQWWLGVVVDEEINRPVVVVHDKATRSKRVVTR